MRLQIWYICAIIICCGEAGAWTGDGPGAPAPGGPAPGGGAADAPGGAAGGGVPASSEPVGIGRLIDLEIPLRTRLAAATLTRCKRIHRKAGVAAFMSMGDERVHHFAFSSPARRSVSSHLHDPSRGAIGAAGRAAFTLNRQHPIGTHRWHDGLALAPTSAFATSTTLPHVPAAGHDNSLATSSHKLFLH